MKTEYAYAIINYHGMCWRIVGQTTEKAVLPDLLAEGWRPVRETAFPHESGSNYILICLEREPETAMGFGFGH